MDNSQKGRIKADDALTPSECITLVSVRLRFGTEFLIAFPHGIIRFGFAMICVRWFMNFAASAPLIAR